MTRFDPDARPDPDAESGVNSEGTTITPMEAVISGQSSKKLHAQAELSAQIMEERQKRAAEPVHMEGLKPLPPGLPRLPNGVIPGGSDALTMVPSMRRSIPAPYRRESINIGRHGKTWAYAQAGSVQPGDLVVDFGKIAAASEELIYDEVVPGIKAPVRAEIRLVNIAGEVRIFGQAEQIRIFRKHEG